MEIVQKLDISKEAEIVVESIKATGDFDLGFAFINGLYDKGLELDGAIGILVDGMSKLWNPSEHDGERFLDVTVRKTPLHPVTVSRHLAVKEFFSTAEIPEHVRPAIEKADQKSIIRIAKAADVHEFTVESWEKIGEAVYSGEKSVSMTIRRITKTAPRSNWLGISIDDKGVLVAHAMEDGEEVHIELGRLHKGNKNKTVQKAIKRIVSCAGITDKVEY